MKALFPLLLLTSTHLHAAQCADWLDVSKRLLHSSEHVELCQLTAQKPVLFVNTASHCGFTGQFEQLEALHQKYKAQGLVVIGIPSDDFYQESDDEAQTAEVCYRNYGVSFTMLTPSSVRGEQADPIFKELARQGSAPKWNFYKYLLNSQGKLVDYWSPLTKPLDNEITTSIEALLAPRL